MYDTAFKGLIRDKDIAKEIIGTLMQTEVIDVELNINQWIRTKKEGEDFPRSVELDYCATILDENNEQKKILIEIQKTTNPEDIMRFRNYLAHAGYGDEHENKKAPLPIVTFYFLGFELENVHTPCLRVSRQYFDMIDGKVLDTKERFVELLTHDSYIIQIPRIKNEEKPVTKLEKILSVFEQNIAERSDKTTLLYKFPLEDDLTKLLINRLLYVYADPVAKQEMKNEEYWRRRDDATFGALLIKEQEIEKSQKEITALKIRNIESAKEFKSMNVDINKISQLTGLSIKEIEEL